MLPSPVPVSAGERYTASWTTSTGFAAQRNSPWPVEIRDGSEFIMTGALLAAAVPEPSFADQQLPAPRGTWNTGGRHPTFEWQNTNYFVDIVFEVPSAGEGCEGL